MATDFVVIMKSPFLTKRFCSSEKALSRECLTCRLQDHVDHEIWLRVHRTVIDAVRLHARTHALGHELLSLLIDNAVLFCEKKPRGLRFPSRRRAGLLNALTRDWPLHGSRNTC